jgi:hypothetical protein
MRLAIRHLRMSRLLLKSGFADGAMFHAYHAYECSLSAFIASSGYFVPPTGWTEIEDPQTKKVIRYYSSPSGLFKEGSAHKARAILFDKLADRTKPYYQTFTLLSPGLSVAIRNDTLYYDVKNQSLPQQQYDAAYVRQLWPKVHQFVGEIRASM